MIQNSKYVDRFTEQIDGITRHGQRIACATEGCMETFDVINSSTSKPDGVVAQMASRTGWKVDLKKGKHICPGCQKEARAEAVRISQAKHAARKAAQTTKPQPQNQEPAPMNMNVKAQPADANSPREMDKTSSRKIFRMLDECYDEPNNRYVTDYTDERIAKELSVPRAWVAKVREEHFGPAGPNPEQARIMEKIQLLESRVITLENAGLELAQNAEKYKAELSELRKQIPTVFGS